MKKTLVTGGAGFLGANLVRRLRAQGHWIRVADNFWRGTRANLEDERGRLLVDDLVECDLCDPAAARKVVAGMDTVIHLAAVVSGIGFVLANEPFVFRTNVLLTSNVLAAAVEAGVSRFLYTGTACSYPRSKQDRPDSPPLVEEDVLPADPESAIGWSRLLGEYECGLRQQYDRLPLCILRLHNLYGPFSDISAERAQVIPALVRKALFYPSTPFTVWGDGEQTRDFVYVEDAVDAILLGLERGIGQGAIQIATNQHTSVRRIAEIIASLSQKQPAIHYDTSKPAGDRGRAGDWSRARTVLGWAPTTSLEAGLEATWRWALEASRDPRRGAELT